MDRIFKMDGPFFRFMNKVGNMILVTLLWIAGCLPVITIGTSTTALYYTSVKVNRKGCGYVAQEFWRSYKLNLKKGIALTAGLLAVTAILVFNRIYVHGMTDAMGASLVVIYNFMLAAVLSLMMYLFPVLSRFTLGIKGLLKLSIYMTVRHLPTTILLDIIFALTCCLIWLIPPLALILPGVVCYGESYLIERVLRKHMPKPEEGSAEAEKWYYQ